MSSTVPITGPLAPNSTSFAAVEDVYVQGGLKVVATAAERDAIPASRRKTGMTVRVLSPAQEFVLTSSADTSPPVWSEKDVDTMRAWVGSGVAGAAATRNASSTGGSYVAVTSGTANYILNSDTQCVTTGNQWRVQRDMDATGLQMRFGAKTNVYWFEVNVWRRVNYYWHLVATTGNIIDLITASANNTITLPRPLRGLKAGDHIGWGLRAHTYPVQPFPYTVVGGSGTRSVITVQTSAVEAVHNMWNYVSVTNQNDLGVPIRLLGPVPDVVAIGDSLTAGSPSTRSAVEAAIDQRGTGGLNYFDLFEPSYQYTAAIESALGLVCQNMGISSQTSAQVLSRFDDDVVALKPRIAIIMAGTNDIATAVSQSTWIANVTAMIEKCLAARIFPVVLGIWPRSDWIIPANYWASQARRAWNTALETLIGTTYWRKAMYVNLDTTLGANYAAGDTGNLDGLQPAYNADSIHLTVAGYTAAGNAIAAAMAAAFKPL